MSAATQPLSDHPGLLKAMLAAERSEIERLRQITLQRHRFGRRAESLPEDQLLLGPEDAEQVEAFGLATVEDAALAEPGAVVAKRRTNRDALPAHLARIERVVDIASRTYPVLLGHAVPDRRRRQRTARHRAA